MGGERVWPEYEPGIALMHWNKEDELLRAHASLSEKWTPRKVHPTEILERIRAYHPGVMPIGYRLRVLGVPPQEFWFWMPRGEWETFFLVTFVGGAVAAAPYRILFYLPLLLVPRILVWPVAVL